MNCLIFHGVVFISCVIFAKGNWNINRNLRDPKKLNSVLQTESQKFNFSDYCMSSEFADIEIRINNDTLAAHKVILSAKNPIFRNRLMNNILESTENVLEITDCNVSTFKTYLRYLYTGKVDNLEEIINLLYLADKYLDQQLKSICECELLNNVTVDNVLLKLSLALQYHCDILKYKTANFVVKHFDEVEKSVEFQSIISTEKIEVFLPVVEIFNRQVHKLEPELRSFQIENIYRYLVSETAEKIYEINNNNDPYVWFIILSVNSIGQLKFGFTNKSPNILKANILFYLASQNSLVQDLKIIDDSNVHVHPNQTKSYNTVSWTFLTTFENRAAFFQGSNLMAKVNIKVI